MTAPIRATAPAPSSDDASRSLRWRVTAALCAVVVTYHATLWSLLRGVTVDTPLAYLGLVPLVAATLGWHLSKVPAGSPELHDRHLDLIVGLPLIAVGLVSLLVLPGRLTTNYWVMRVDLLTMPFFVAGVVAVLFGVRTLWRVKAAVLFSFLAWPIPFRGAVTRWLEPFTELTARAVDRVVNVVPVAIATGVDGITFRVPHGDDGFLVTIASACSGANGVLGFLLVGGAIALGVQGPRGRKLAWLAAGLALVWALNLARILAILAVGRWFGQRAAIDVLHPWVGLLTFNVAALVMLANLRRFGLGKRTGTTPAGPSVARAVPSAAGWVGVLLVVAVLGGVADHGLRRYDPIASSVGSSLLLPYRFVGTKVPRAEARAQVSFEHHRRFFGESSSWVRYAYRTPDETVPRTNVPVLADVITSDSLQSFSDFGIEACYRFHGYDTGDSRAVDLDHGVRGHLVRWQDADTGLDWSSLYWILPVRHGSEVRYERTVLLLNVDRRIRVEVPELPDAVLAQLGIDPEDHAGAAEAPELAERSSDEDLDAFLVGFARDVVNANVTNSAAQLERAGAS